MTLIRQILEQKKKVFLPMALFLVLIDQSVKIAFQPEIPLNPIFFSY
ncbi:hypothetical protein LJC22_02985 [Desulfosarcina sp. OttesenSCG-928-G10]|nr:hypothetical protein [Desulfosarcina sp. OttesenSCG-928-G10]MDL2321946.1 hypothetical protein [Desulfosarcina sp. OttesenSCG-928-B08]